MNEPIMEMCDEGNHKFYKLPDHPKNSLGNAVCPYCLVIGRERLQAELDQVNAEWVKAAMACGKAVQEIHELRAENAILRKAQEK